MDSVATQYANIVAQFKIAGEEKVREQFKKISKGFMTLNQLQQKVSKQKGGFGGTQKKKDFLGLNEAGKQFEMFGKRSRNGFKVVEGGRKHLLAMRDANDSFGKVMGLSMEKWRHLNDAGVKFNTIGGRVANKTRMMTHGMRGFRMEMLGVMFFGMAMTRFFKGLINPAAKSFGIMELWGDMLTVVFLPIMAAMMPYFIDFVTWMMKISPTAKTLIGVITLIGIVLGTVAMLVGTFALGLGSAILAGIPIILAITAVIVGIGLTFIGVRDIVKNWGKDSKKTFSGISKALIGIGLILAVFVGWWALIPIAVGVIIALLVNHWDGFAAFFKRLWLRLKIFVQEGILGWTIAIRNYTRFMSKIPIIGLAFKKSLRDANDEIIKQNASLVLNRNELEKQIALKNELKNKNNEMSQQNQVSSIGSMQEQFMNSPNGPMSKQPVVVNQYNTMTVENDEHIKSVFKNTIMKEITDLQSNMG